MPASTSRPRHRATFKPEGCILPPQEALWFDDAWLNFDPVVFSYPPGRITTATLLKEPYLGVIYDMEVRIDDVVYRNKVRVESVEEVYHNVLVPSEQPEYWDGDYPSPEYFIARVVRYETVFRVATPVWSVPRRPAPLNISMFNS